MTRRLCSLLGFSAICAGQLLAWDPFLTPNFRAKDLKGTWSLQLGQVKHVISFREGWIFDGICYENERVIDEYAGQWSLDERDILTWTYLKSSRVKAGMTDRDKVVGRTADTLSLLSARRELRTWHREEVAQGKP